MKIIPVKFDLKLYQDDDRSEGTHVSHVIRLLGLKMGYLAPQYASDEVRDPTRMELGSAWEDRVFPIHHPEIAYHPGEMIKDGIAGTADGVYWFNKGAHRISECKLTWKSMKKALNLEDEWMWLGQTKAYCKLWDTNLARYHIFWVNGNYKYGTPEGQPQYWLYDLEFTSKEINDNWKMLTNYSTTIGDK